jgi:hypothetical protein
VQVSHSFAVASAVFDDEHLVSYAGLVPVMTLAEQTGLSRLLGAKVHIAEPRIKSGAANPASKLASVVAGMCVGADCIDDIDAVRSGGMTTLFDGVYAPSTVGMLLREFTFGHSRQLESVLREHLVASCERVDLLAGVGQDVFSESTRCCARSTGMPNRVPPTGTPRLPANRSCAKDCPRWPPGSAPRVRLR